jgi:D-sedoheptulose 7-phosphate isomerase
MNPFTPLPVALLAGGLATRLRPLTDVIPKSLVAVNGEPFIAHQLRNLRHAGLQRVVILCGHLGEQIAAYVGDGAQFGLDVDYVHDGPVLLGTAGAIKRALPRLGPAFFTLYGDSYLTCDYLGIQARFLSDGRQALMTVYRNEGLFDASNVVWDGEIRIYDKQNKRHDMRHIDYGLGLFHASAFDDVPEGKPADLSALYQRRLSNSQLVGVEVFERFYEIGSLAGINDLSSFLLSHPLPRLATEPTMSFADQFLAESIQIINKIDRSKVEAMADHLAATRTRSGRLFILGVGGSAGNAAHAVNDFRKITGIETYAPTDNVSELTARTNDDGWASIFANWLKVSRLRKDDTLLILSVGGGNLEKNVSPNLVEAIKLAKDVGATILGIVGKDGGYAGQHADVAVIIPTVNADHITPHQESFQAVVWHLLVSHPKLKASQTKWESVQ